MINEIPAVNEYASQVFNQEPGVNAFLAKAASGVGIEELILQDTQEQRKAATAIRKARRDQRRRLVERAVKKMKDAADDRFWSGLVGTLSSAAGEILGAFDLGKWTKAISEGTKVLGGNLAKHFLCDLPAAENEGAAKLLQDSAQASGDAARDTSDWLSSAKELERRMIDRIDQLTRSEHESHMGIVRHI